ncbi:hypothetical protein CNMCM8980_005200 [Aspergillus fumigatiaffinis]|uniref:Major facilitator superfamily (MFS) profile domain-containing protein n=1 Tax=Aspergillus fumigatiaffinis TaxID=340414 RepID=A0A8H4EAG3_9EURO|nr:hypothetical protein CNMCM5878_005180 [Aspergillus fumigatiaffinis]KAF4216967.1 hypothetical protein CNMCM6457_004750 [Aspergillus fumigatiaffinis]KAF4226280.1 hypothetical protein CNMCM6805_004766 [Aspergillus fumigatiaffinis]KAF4231714.1 hypothetical protein CNMCM8980_005200 [Aspergillus fumigatiaffinis]
MDMEEPSIIDWDGPYDPARPVNWSKSKKWQNIFSIAFLTFLTPFASSIAAPAVHMIMGTFHSTNKVLGSFVVSVYLLGFAVGPLVLAPLSETYGRLYVYQVSTAIFILWNVACALAPNVGALLAFRLFAGISGSSPLSLGAGSVADLFVEKERGVAMALYGIGQLMGPVIGPIAGGYLSEAAGWRWVFWLLVVMSGVALLFATILQSETFEPVLLQRRIKQRRKETGDRILRSISARRIDPKQNMDQSIVRPLKLLALSPIVALFSIYMGVVVGYLYLLFTTIPAVYRETYHFSEGSSGLVYIGVGVGALIGMAAFGALSDRILVRLTAKNNGTPEPEFRLPLLVPGSLLLPFGFFWYGWSADKRLHWMMPVVGIGWMGFGITATSLAIQGYLIDAYSEYAASAIAAATVFRCLIGAFLPLAGPPMYSSLGLGWGNSLLGFIGLGLLPLPAVFYFYGRAIRTSPRFRVSL